MKKKFVGLLMAVLLCFHFSVSFAAGAAKTSADFSDLQDLDAATKAKFDALISAGVFNGVSETKFGIGDEMNRAQFAKVAALIFDLEVNKDAKTSSFKDVKADDPANGYALPFIEAVKAAGITEGYGEGIYDPAGKVTKEQLATFLVRGLDMNEEAKATPGVNDATVSDWAKGYVALALEKKLLDNGSDGQFGGQTNATRDLLLTGAFEAQSQYTAQVEQKKKEEEEKKKEEELKKAEEERKKQEAQSWSPTPLPVQQEEPTPTPPPVQATVETPAALPAGGAVTPGTQVTLTSATASAAVYYTTDLSEPTAFSTPYTGPIVITSSTTIKAIAVKPGSTNSTVASFEYKVAMPIVLPDSISPSTSAEGQPYTSNVAKLSGGTGAVTYVVTSGALPVGLTLNPSTGEISGTPSVSGDYNFTISATDSAAPPATATMPYTVTIAPSLSKTALALINAASESGDWDHVDLTTFAEAGVTGVTSENFYSVQYYLDPAVSTHSPLPRTLADIQAIVDETIQQMTVDAIYAYLNPFGGGSAPTVEAFARAGITGVDAANLDAILDELRLAYQESRNDPFGTPMSTKQDIQDVVDRFLTV
ncbi:chitobiase/beta-hexosaminidase C-terminal domain-containing protein [Cohnella hashimotonis]|uniref:Chitobiase/beta-hexosaminidase C-terminal domain-containing protein n=1 Tax=Cohnella hashimotonis TaxID=2826895 RepID=A0ABT6TQE6_9BACL|nr:chitobiase/beta-hexosaminidase C-terminal domain-containing protein [Cohnella hashimotonis]MDI4648042.1 chitobiase/beta-hexosaminidase C-terminal domain-containing protein [Cohnella hashimotonis]